MREERNVRINLSITKSQHDVLKKLMESNPSLSAAGAAYQVFCAGIDAVNGVNAGVKNEADIVKLKEALWVLNDEIMKVPAKVVDEIIRRKNGGAK